MFFTITIECVHLFSFAVSKMNYIFIYLGWCAIVSVLFGCAISYLSINKHLRQVCLLVWQLFYISFLTSKQEIPLISYTY